VFVCPSFFRQKLVAAKSAAEEHLRHLETVWMDQQKQSVEDAVRHCEIALRAEFAARCVQVRACIHTRVCANIYYDLRFTRKVIAIAKKKAGCV
jgi:hypothetical protein